MIHKFASSDVGLHEAVETLRAALGPTNEDGIMIAPLWTEDVGCLGLIALANLPYAQSRARDEHQRQKFPGNVTRANLSKRARTLQKGRCPYTVGEDILGCMVRIGLALGSAVHRVRTHELLVAIHDDTGVTSSRDGAELGASVETRRPNTVYNNPRCR